ncbi:MlaE family lipid ABC transporter permease subunit [Helicobacter sp. 11S02596-1]|uniref:MlaE family lipid ABC transporter permease subunit n=1 Tax=Helicobacter sp. 11S02596-1 TaxID=1476194 RepID=UPI000BA6AFDF|nr:MlaE family lipid ABC transporter permease subunit [Helicobacter sp. 11S02596-1]PAF42130.1 ABC transporter [Helicobacter sp. 11S02596-1]
MPATSLRIIQDSQKTILSLEGNWDFQTSPKHLQSLKQALQSLKQTPSSTGFSNDFAIDFSATTHLDFIFAVFLLNLLKSLSLYPTLLHASDKTERILEIIHTWLAQETPPDPPATPKAFGNIFGIHIFEGLGRGVERFFQKTLDFFNFCGMTLYFFIQSLIHPSKIRLASLFYHINESGFKALPVSVLTAFIVGAAVSLQGAMQLQNMGVPLMSVETTAKLSLREMGPFILALVIAGRSASSFTAQIGVMKITEEIDAMETMSFNVFEFLVLPRVLALIVAMPLMVFLADAFALLGGMVAIKYQLGIGFGNYIERFYETVSWRHFWIGMLKAPFFGWAIAMVGCFRGFEVRGDTESVGRLTTISVVNALFWIIFINATFSVIFTRLQL